MSGDRGAAEASRGTAGGAAADTQPGDKVDFDDYSANYDELLRESTKLYADDSEYFARYKVDLIRKAAAGSGASVRRVLEYGCGTGRNISYLRAAFPGAEVVGTDVSAESLRVARAGNPQQRFEVEQEGLELGRFDLIFVASVFHHIPPAVRATVMGTLSRRLEPNGSIDVFEHNPYNPVTRRIVDNCPFDADAILLKPPELRDLFAGAGLKLQRQTYCLFVPPRLKWFLPLERFLGWLPLGGQYWMSAGREA
ncbi:class I SAM-dependent methyltransferase [Variovorax defluvii]|uniref:Class I SAM-dependent methyltransferase n=1 Tax=Variovorax defluvii TaxID=913761 RepID=A0ABP8HDS4_9BURK